MSVELSVVASGASVGVGVGVGGCGLGAGGGAVEQCFAGRRLCW